ncbi:O-antigen ligase family protein [Candidatus Roizmanbacteria bacterium]|nr:MAG: O-antigen ligase family protein [Candidatus Roizmanbacteria bacterium]
MNILKKQKLELLFYLLSIFLLRVPIISIQGIPLFSTHVLAVAVILFLFSKAIFNTFREKKPLVSLSTETVVILTFFLTQGLSALYTVSISSFLNRFVKLSIALLLFMVTKRFLHKYSLYPYILNTLLISSAITVVFQIILYIAPDQYLTVMNFFQQVNLTSVTEANITYHKLFDDTYIESVLPIAFYQMQAGQTVLLRGLSTTLLYVTFIVSFISNFRYRLVSALFSLAASFITLTQHRLKIFLPILMISTFISLLILLDFIFLQTSAFTIIDRFLLRSSVTDSSSLVWRLEMAKESIEMAKTFPTGVGLGNFQDYLPFRNTNYTLFSSREVIAEGAITAGPHNIFFQTLGETGFPGLMALVAMLLVFLRKDIQTLHSQRSDKKAIIISFWTLVVMLQFFPGTNLSYYTLFFLLRALV